MLALWNSKKDIALLLSTIVITCLICGPCIYFLEVGGGLIPNSRSGNLVSIPDCEYRQTQSLIKTNKF